MPNFSLAEMNTESSALPTLMVIPSGIGCSIGGYAGDAIPAARLLAGACGYLVTHPNVMNGGSLYWRDSRIQYVEGYALDRFAAGEIALRPVRQQKIGVLFDAAIEPDLLYRNLQLVDGCRATLGLNVGPIVTTDVPLEVRLDRGSSGSSWGVLGRPEALIRGGELLKEQGATAIAVVTRFPDDLASDKVAAYRQGNGVDILAGAEAVISHLLVQHLFLPCAHAPALPCLPLDPNLDPRAAGEEVGHTFLACVLVGLSKAPDLIPTSINYELAQMSLAGLMHIDQIGALVAVEGALGGEVVLSCLERGLPIISVVNQGVLDVTAQKLGLKYRCDSKDESNVFLARNYLEAAGILTLLREGINFESVKRPLLGINEL